MKFIKIFIAVILITYLATSFINLSFNVTTWSLESRQNFLVMAGGIIAFVSIVNYIEKNDKNNGY